MVAVGAEADDERIELLLSEVKGKDVTELIAAGREKLASVPGGGGVAVAAPVAGGGGAPAAAAEPKKEEKVEEKEESDDVIFLLIRTYIDSFLLASVKSHCYVLAILLFLSF
jgi:large subunit ribosomal protein LP2